MTRARRSRGVAAIEMGLILPLFCLLLFGLIDYGYWFMVDLATTNAVREGTRAATTIAGACPNGAATAQGKSMMSTYLTNANLARIGTVTSSCACTTVASGPQFQCTLRIDFPRLTGYSLVPMPAAGGSYGSKYTSVQAIATMRGSN
jgi:Flp pilus assembly protein TadG